jgi:hypothetical protein
MGHDVTTNGLLRIGDKHGAAINLGDNLIRDNDGNAELGVRVGGVSRLGGSERERGRGREKLTSSVRRRSMRRKRARCI